MPDAPVPPIAVLDDDDLMAGLLAKLIGNATAFSNEREFLRSSDEFPIALVDWLMPELTGADVLVELRKLKREVLVIGMSGDVRAEDAMREAGAVEFLHKPFSPTEVREVVARIRRTAADRVSETPAL